MSYDALTYYFHDSGLAANSGHFVVNRTVIANGGDLSLSAAAQTTFVAGAAGTSDTLYVQLSDGRDISGLGIFQVNVASPLPASANGSDNFIFVPDLGDKAALDYSQGFPDNHAVGGNLSADQMIGLGEVASPVITSDVDLLALFGMHAIDHFAF